MNLNRTLPTSIRQGALTCLKRGPAVCEVLDISQVDAVVAGLGLDPLRTDADPVWPWKRITK
jgi:hypothetical protein